MKTLIFYLITVISCSISCFAQESNNVDRKNHREVAKFFCENYHRGNFESAKNVVGKIFHNAIQNSCERNLCDSEVDKNFIYQVISDQVNYRDATANIRYRWSEDKFLEVILFQDENYDWFVYIYTQTDQARDISQLRPKMTIQDDQFVESTIDRTNYAKVAKYYSENYFHGNFENAIKVVRPSFITTINNRCIKRDKCDNDVNLDFEFRKISEWVDFSRGNARIKFYWGSNKFLDVSLYQYDNGDWIILGCTPQRLAMEISTIRSGPKIPGAVSKN